MKWQAFIVLPVILAGGYSGSVDAGRLGDAGIWEWLEKPIFPALLAEAVTRALQQA